MESIDLHKDRHQTPPEKIRQEKHDRLLTDKAEQRSQRCWCDDCDKLSLVWVREVQFDLKEEKAGINHAMVSSKDYDGPVPGFCWKHLYTGPAELAQVVYYSRPEVQWGFRPNRWFVIFTDGNKIGGNCIEFDAPPTVVTEEHISVT